MHALLDLLRRHTSVRDYTDEPIPAATWDAVLSCGQQASTDATGQLYAAVEVRDPALRAHVETLAGGQKHVRTAARFLVVCLDVRRLRLLLESRGERLGIRPHVALLFGITDAALFAQNVVVAAEALGYGCCYIGGVQNHAREMARLLDLPVGVVPLWGLAVGRPAQPPKPPKPRTPLDLVVHVDRYRDPAPDRLARTFDAMRAATRSGDWLNPIRRYFAGGGVMEAREAEFHALLAEHGLDPCASGVVPTSR